MVEGGDAQEKTWQQIVVDEGYCSPELMAKVEKDAAAANADPLDYCFATGVLTRSLFGQAIAEHYGVGFVDLAARPPDKTLLEEIPEDIAREDRRLLISRTATEAVFATDQPQVSFPLEYAEHYPGLQLRAVYALPDDIDLAFDAYRKPLDTRFAAILANNERVAADIIDEIMQDALAFRASDIHFEPNEQDALIRFRVDGVLHEAGNLPLDLYENVVNRIKVQAHLRTDLHFGAQDGAIRYKVHGESVDVRVSIVPLLDGEKIVFRLLADYMRQFQMSDLGMSPAHQAQLLTSSNKPYGMVLVVGPTGSGKTTTLYAAVKSLNHSDVNVSTIEDPVEYKISGVNHIQVNVQTQLTFSKGLRSIVRQDPDVILVGEIRDEETVDIALNAALTGHMLLSTFHANDAASAVPRLMDMGAEPFLLSSALELIIAQRLVRKICHGCRASVVGTREELAAAFPGVATYLPEGTLTLYRGKGCSACGMTGYRGRIGIYELIPVTQKMREAIMRRPSAQEIAALAAKEGCGSMFADGLTKVMSGVTSLEELARTAQPPEVYGTA